MGASLHVFVLGVSGMAAEVFATSLGAVPALELRDLLTSPACALPQRRVIRGSKANAKADRWKARQIWPMESWNPRVHCCRGAAASTLVKQF